MQTTAIRQHRTTHTHTKESSVQVIYIIHKLLKISAYLQTAFAAETRLAEGQGLKEQVNRVKLRIFRVGTRGQRGNI
jgi:hypothetical protein